jgi:hypothetical protein
LGETHAIAISQVCHPDEIKVLRLEPSPGESLGQASPALRKERVRNRHAG